MAIDFEQEFEKFVTSDQQGNAIKDIYSIIPSLTQEQMEIVNALSFYIKRYELHDLNEYLQNYLLSMKTNKNLNFMSSMNMKNLLRAYTQDELIRGIKISSSNINGSD